MKLKHLTISKGLYIYQRRFPTDLLQHPNVKTKLYKKSLKLNADASQESVLAAWKSIDKDFSDYIDLLRCANLDQLEQARKIELANALIRANDLKPGMLAPDPALSNVQNEALIANAHHYVSATGLFDDLEEYSHPESDKKLSPALEIKSLAWKILEHPATSTSQAITLSDCWDIYNRQKQLDETDSSVRKSKARYMRFVEIAGDTLLSQSVVTKALNDYVDHREADRERNRTLGKKASPSAQSIGRELNTIVAVLNEAIRKRGLDIKVTRPSLQQTKKQEKYTFTREEQVELVRLIQDQTNKAYAPWKELMFLLMVQTAAIQSELLRLRKDAVHLDHEVPHIDFVGELKTAERTRTNPIVYQLSRIKELIKDIDDGSEFVFGVLRNKTPSTINKSLVLLSQKINPAATPYSLRHAFKNDAFANNVDVQSIAALGGWSGKELGFNTIMADYGKSGIRHLDTLRSLQRAMITINSHLLSADSGNVVDLQSYRI